VWLSSFQQLRRRNGSNDEGEQFVVPLFDPSITWMRDGRGSEARDSRARSPSSAASDGVSVEMPIAS